ncbi:MAG: hypothetical protein ACK4IT_00855 [Thioalkalivibrionaceae bacterium]
MAAITSALILTGCGTLPDAADPGAQHNAPLDPSAYWIAPPISSTLVLNETLEIRPGAARVWIGTGAPSDFAVQCNLEVFTLDRDNPTLITPDRFVIERTQRFTTTVDASPATTPPAYATAHHRATLSHAQPLNPARTFGAFQRTAHHAYRGGPNGDAANPMNALSWFTDYDDSPTRVFEGWHWYLRSDNQPDVYRLNCRGPYADPWEALPPSIDDIRQALGRVMTLELAPAR